MYTRRHLLGHHYVQGVIHAIILEHIHGILYRLSIISSAHIMVTYIHGVALFSFFPLLPLCYLFSLPLVLPLTYLAPSSCGRSVLPLIRFLVD